MVERVILFKLNDTAEREALAAKTLALLSQLPGVEEVSVGVPADAASERSWDLSIVLGFANVALLDKVLASALFATYLDVTMRDRYAVMKAWSFERLV